MPQVRCQVSEASPKGVCPKCGRERYIPTVHEGSVRKYLEVSIKVAEEYGVKSTKQRLQLLKIEIDSLFNNDKSKQMGLADFM